MKLIMLIFTYLAILVVGLYDYQSSGDIELFTHYDKFIHFFQYFILAIIASSIFYAKHLFILKLIVFIAISSLTIECMQSYIPSRNSSAGDFFFDILGGFMGLLTFLKFKKK